SLRPSRTAWRSATRSRTRRNTRGRRSKPPSAPAWGSTFPTACSGRAKTRRRAKARIRSPKGWSDMSGTIRGLYAVTPDLADTAAMLGKVEAALAGGARLLQYRNKVADAALRLEQAGALAALCRRHGVPLIVNDHLDLALAVDADGLHIGGEDGSVAEARRRLGPSKLLGVSCYRRIENAHDAARAGADHVAFGGFFASQVKPSATRAPLSLLTDAKRAQAL